MDDLTKYSVLATQLSQDEPEVPIMPIPSYARAYTGGYYCCRSCGKLFVDVASIRRHQAQYCDSYRESDRVLSTSRLMGS